MPTNAGYRPPRGGGGSRPVGSHGAPRHGPRPKSPTGVFPPLRIRGRDSTHPPGRHGNNRCVTTVYECWQHPLQHPTARLARPARQRAAKVSPHLGQMAPPRPVGSTPDAPARCDGPRCHRSSGRRRAPTANNQGATPTRRGRPAPLLPRALHGSAPAAPGTAAAQAVPRQAPARSGRTATQRRCGGVCAHPGRRRPPRRARHTSLPAALAAVRPAAVAPGCSRESPPGLSEGPPRHGPQRAQVARPGPSGHIAKCSRHTRSQITPPAPGVAPRRGRGPRSTTERPWGHPSKPVAAPLGRRVRPTGPVVPDSRPAAGDLDLFRRDASPRHAPQRTALPLPDVGGTLSAMSPSLAQPQKNGGESNVL